MNMWKSCSQVLQNISLGNGILALVGKNNCQLFLLLILPAISSCVATLILPYSARASFQSLAIVDTTSSARVLPFAADIWLLCNARLRFSVCLRIIIPNSQPNTKSNDGLHTTNCCFHSFVHLHLLQYQILLEISNPGSCLKQTGQCFSLSFPFLKKCRFPLNLHLWQIPMSTFKSDFGTDERSSWRSKNKSYLFWLIPYTG